MFCFCRSFFAFSTRFFYLKFISFGCRRLTLKFVGDEIDLHHKSAVVKYGKLSLWIVGNALVQFLRILS